MVSRLRARRFWRTLARGEVSTGDQTGSMEMLMARYKKRPPEGGQGEARGGDQRLGGSITVSITWTTPLVAVRSAFVTSAPSTFT